MVPWVGVSRFMIPPRPGFAVATLPFQGRNKNGKRSVRPAPPHFLNPRTLSNFRGIPDEAPDREDRWPPNARSMSPS